VEGGEKRGREGKDGIGRGGKVGVEGPHSWILDMPLNKNIKKLLMNDQKFLDFVRCNLGTRNS